MHPRTEVREMFSTFVKFNSNGRFLNWISSIKLRRSMEKSWEQYIPANNSPEFWASYWYEFWLNRSSNLAKDHIYAYLQEPCYQAAEKFWYKYHIKFPDYKTEDYFQIAISHVDRFLPKINPNIFNIKNYAKTIFSNAITDKMRRANKSVGHSDWSLLINTSETAFRNSLQTFGYLTVPIDSYLLAWDCFKEIYASDRTQINKQLAAPNREIWQQISQLYNQLRQPTDAESNANAIAQWMQSAARAIRQSLAPPITSLNQVIGDEDGRELQDCLPSNNEEETEQSINPDATDQINILLINVLQEIDKKAQEVPTNKKAETAQEILKILPLFYQQSLSETEIGKLLGIKQYTVSRRLKVVKENMLLSLSEWAKSTLQISIDSHTINYINHLIEDWLDRYFATIGETSHEYRIN
jgi:RNA polymerase sigma factor (sigma-70 family)